MTKVNVDGAYQACLLSSRLAASTTLHITPWHACKAFVSVLNALDLPVESAGTATFDRALVIASSTFSS